MHPFIWWVTLAAGPASAICCPAQLEKKQRELLLRLFPTQLRTHLDVVASVSSFTVSFTSLSCEPLWVVLLHTVPPALTKPHFKVHHHLACSLQMISALSAFDYVCPLLSEWVSSSSLPVSCCGIEVTCTRCTSSCLERVDCCLCHSSILVAAHFTVRGGGVCLPTRRKHFSKELFEAGQFRLESQGWQTRCIFWLLQVGIKKSSPQIAVMEFCYSIFL